jgi:poly(3-hydroxybutyrate) depolymerase
LPFFFAIFPFFTRQFIIQNCDYAVWVVFRRVAGPALEINARQRLFAKVSVTMSIVVAPLRAHVPLLFLVAILLILPPNVAIALDVNLSTGNLVYINEDGNSMPYRLYVPPGYDTPGAQFPLIMFLHGSGESGTNNTSPSNSNVNNLYNAAHGNYGAQYKAFLLVPQTTRSWDWQYDPDYPYPEDFPENGIGQQLAMNILDLVTSTYQVDSTRLYVTGLSMGGGGTFDIIANHPNTFAAAAPLSGYGSPSDASIIKNIPIWAYHGTSDNTVTVDNTDNMIDAIEAAGGVNVEYSRVQGVGHGGWSTFYDGKTYKNSNGETVYQWMFAQSIPEPSSAALGLGAVGFSMLYWIRKRSRKRVADSTL